MVAQKSHRTTLPGRPPRPQFGILDTGIGRTCGHIAGLGLGRALRGGPWDRARDFQRFRDGDFYPEKNLSLVVAFDIRVWPHYITTQTVQEII